MPRNIFSRALSQIQGTDASSTHSTEAKVSDAQNETEEALVAGYQSTRSPFDPDYKKPKKAAGKKQASPEARLDAVIKSESTDVWQRLRFATEGKEKRDRARFQKEQEGKADGK